MNGRGTLVAITDQGITLINTATPALNAFFQDFGLDKTDRDQLFALCNKLRLNYGDAVEN